MGLNNVIVNGSWDASGGTFDGLNTVIFTSQSTETITVNASAFNNIVFVTGNNPNKQFGKWTTVGNLRVLGTQTVQNATGSDTTPPVITNINANPVYDKTALVTWDTDEGADTQVQYGTMSGVYVYSYTGAALDTSHTATLQGLTPLTTYYYRVESEDLSGNMAAGSPHSFTTLTKLSTAEELAQAEAIAKAEGVAQGITQAATTGSNGGGGGGGSNSCGSSRGKNALAISNLNILPNNDGTAVISWKTNTDADALVQYGITSVDESDKFSVKTFNTDHNLTITGLSNAQYQLQAMSFDQCGNSVSSDVVTFTASGSGVASLDPNASPGQKLSALQSLLQQLKSVVSLSDFKGALADASATIQDLAKLVPGPALGGEPKVTPADTTASVEWTTSELADATVSYSPDSLFSQSGTYTASVSGGEQNATDHTVTVSGLLPGTVYHYQVTSKTPFGTTTSSKDFTFTTQQELISVLNYSVKVLSKNSATFTWTTNVPTTSVVTETPYRNGNPDPQGNQVTQTKEQSLSHSITVNDLEPGVLYDIEIGGQNPAGVIVSKILPHFSTSTDKIAPDVSGVQTDSAIVPGKDAKIQTVISWDTNEQSTSRVLYQKGVATDPTQQLTDTTTLDPSYTKKHTVLLPSLDPGEIYSFQVESTNSSGDTTRSKTYTILTPRQQEGVIQVIFTQLQDTFGWLNNLRGN